MSLRDADYSELCAICRKPTRQGCARCGRPLCDRHMHRPKARCASCESEWRDEILKKEVEQAEYLVAQRGPFKLLSIAALGALWVKTAAKWSWLKLSRHRKQFLDERLDSAAWLYPD